MSTRAKQNLLTEISWAAGFFDGEAYIGITRDFGNKYQKYYYKVCIRVGQVSRLPLDKLQSMFGGKICRCKNAHQGYWEWRVSGQDVYAVLRLVLPYLVLKHRQAELVLQFGATTPSKNHWGHVVAVTEEVTKHRRSIWAAVCELNGGRALRAERLNEKAPTEQSEGDAIVRPHANNKHESDAEMTSPLVH